jgi:hypothetical protein
LLVAAGVAAILVVGGVVVAASPWDRAAGASGGAGATTTLQRPTSTSGPAPTTVPPPPGTRSVLLREDFSGPSERWPDGGRPEGSVGHEGGAYRFHGTRPSTMMRAGPIAPALTGARLLLEVSAKRVGGAADTGFGLYCRRDAGTNSHYSLYVQDDGKFWIDKLLRGTWVSLEKGSNRAAIRAGGVNRLQAVCSGGEDGGPVTVSLTVNGKLLSRVVDRRDPLPDGTAGVQVTTPSRVPVDVDLDDFAAYAL